MLTGELGLSAILFKMTAILEPHLSLFKFGLPDSLGMGWAKFPPVVCDARDFSWASFDPTVGLSSTYPASPWVGFPSEWTAPRERKMAKPLRTTIFSLKKKDVARFKIL